MKQILTLLLFCILSVPMVIFAIENRTLIKIDLNPFDFFDTQITELTTLPLSFVLFVGFLLGLFLGLLFMRFRP